MASRTRKMVNLAIEETSGVDHPAHLTEGWLVMKSAEASDVQRVIDESLTEEASMSEETTTTATEEVVAEVETPVENTMTLEEAIVKIDELEKAMKKKPAFLYAAKDMNMDPEEMSEEQGTNESDADYAARMKSMKMSKSETTEDFLKSAPTPVVKMIEDLRKEADTAKEELRKERDTRADAEAVEKAKTWGHLNLDADKVGPALRRLSTLDEELYKAIEATLSSVNAQAESSNIFAEIGKSADFNKSGNAYDRMTAMAKSAVEEGVAKSFADAISSVASNNPDLYSQYLTEKGA